ncbi:glutamate dehydrogenase [Pueribacillus theae]|uniref:Glutamate dehydrogenase n=1 Tax=Pueribacillus theae TaxID=2171751 RepID=A0A2U1JZU1_9BACI|nr:Glu/Leu/Phe/Val dehydrogenase dimerization domain-containing protein [Pueribacillus theae]PWA10757.1 glutamate dehydrogenase [Pueribacillus theae]
MLTSYLVTEWTDPITKAKGYVAFDSVVNGVAGGGIRMREGVTKEEVQRLARTMTLKVAALDQPIGGVKGGIDYPSTAPDSKEVLKRFLEAHKPILMHMWGTSEDLGTRKEDIEHIIVHDLGLQSSAEALLNKLDNKEMIMSNLNKGLQLSVDGIPIVEVATGYGVSVATIEAVQWLGKDINAATVSIQGFGSVGATTAKSLSKEGAKIVAVADVNGTIFHPDGLDIDLLLQAKDEKGNIHREMLPAEYENLPRSAWLEQEVDVLIPAAIADAINEDNQSSIKAQLIVEAANIPVTEEAERILFEKEVYVIPDFIANSGGGGIFGALMYKNVSPDVESILGYLNKQISGATKSMLSQSAEQKITPRQAAIQQLDKDRVTLSE